MFRLTAISEIRTPNPAGDFWFLALVAESAEGRRGFQPIRRDGAITTNDLVAERRWNHRHAIGRQIASWNTQTQPGIMSVKR